MRYAAVLFLAVLLLASMTIRTFAMARDPAEIIEEKVFPVCIDVKRSYLYEGPAASITNGCAGTIFIKDVLTARATGILKTPVSQINVRLVSNEYAEVSYFIFSKDGMECKYPLEYESHDNPHCKNLVLPSGDTIDFLMPYGTYFLISGDIKSGKTSVSKSSNISIEGKMINPRDTKEH